ncbi:MAG TPA: HAD hydrolase-like protein [Polyangiaceae bacterium]|nr:HAD hydrolase-like protein [Polyangiaceae bacterium]
MTSAGELGERYRRAPCVFFDCDGVIFDSNGFKIEAMRRTLDGHQPSQVAQMEDFWRSNGGVSRFVKFEHFFTHIAPQADVQGHMRAACARFGALSRAAYDEKEPLPQALRLARATGAERCHVVSGAAQSELVSVFAAKNIGGLFASILGSPRTKLELCQGVLAERRCPPSDAILIGDGAMDFRVCRELGIHFVYLEQFSEWAGAEAALAGAAGVSIASRWDDLLALLLER